MSEASHRLVSAFFEAQDLGQVEVKGHAPVHAWEALRPRFRRSRLEATAERGLTPLVGRSRELGTLLERFAETKAGRGQVVFVSGDAGLGKSRLLLEFRRRIAESGEPVTTTPSSPCTSGRGSTNATCASSRARSPITRVNHSR